MIYFRVIMVAVIIGLIGYIGMEIRNGLIEQGRAAEAAVCKMEKDAAKENNLQIREKMNEDRNNRPSRLALDSVLRAGTF